jgi:ABC-type branched-subunit amino acid transport system substrate-binding protein
MNHRRQFLAQLTALTAGCATAHRSFGARADTVRLGQSVALTGPLAELGQALHTGSQAAFNAVNAKGGVNGRRIELVVQDDGYDVKRSLANVKGFLGDSSMFGLFGCMGTPMIEAMLPLLRDTEVPCFAPLTGAMLARPADMRNVMNIRASYPEETRRLIQHLATIGIRRIGVAYQNNAFGKEVHKAAVEAAQTYHVTIIVSASIENSAADAGAAAAQIAAKQPEAIFLGLAGKPTIEFVRSIKRARSGAPLYALSVMGSAATLQALKDDAVGLAMSQVVPLPSNSVVPLVREFGQAWAALGTKLEPSHTALEGYINARVFAEALRRAGPTASRAQFIQAVWALKQYDLGGFQVGFDQPGRNASRFIELTMVSRDGRFIR